MPSHSIAPVVVCVGTEDLLWNEALVRLSQACIKPGSESLDRVVLHADAAAEEIFLALQTPPMTSPKRLVVLENFLETKGDALDWLVRYAAHPNMNACLVVRTEEPLPAATASVLRSVSQEISCQPLKDAALEGWLKQRAQKEYGKMLQPEAARLLIERTGISMSLLSQRLEQLALYAADRGQVTAGDVTALIGWSVEERAFGLVDAIVRRNRVTALRMLRRLLVEEGVAPEEILGALSWHFRRLGKAVYRVGRGEPAPTVVQSLGIPWRAQAGYLAAIRSLRWPQAVRILQELVEMDEQLKTGRGGALGLLEPFVWRLAGSGELAKTAA